MFNSGPDTTGEDRSHRKKEKTEMARARSANGQQTAKTSCTMGYKWLKEKVWKTTKELDRHPYNKT